MKYSHKHGTRNPIIEQEEKLILLSVDKALSSSPNSQTIGRNGELPLISFFNRYLPPTFKAATGHFITPNGEVSPQIDIMILDSRYPLLAENVDGSVLVMLHSVVETIEIKTNLTSTELKKVALNIKKIRSLMSEIDIFKNLDSFMIPTTLVIAYRIKNTLDRIEDVFQECCEPDVAHFDLSILRLPEKRLKIKDVGCQLHYDPVTGDEIEKLLTEYEMPKSRIKNGYIFTSGASYTPLSDIYYRMVQNGYYSLGDRNFSATDIGRHVMEYMNWSSASWDDIYE